MLTSEGLMISAEAEQGSSSGLRQLAWSQRHTFDQGGFARAQHRNALVARSLRYKEILTLVCTFQCFGQLEVQVPALCDAEQGISLF